MSIQYQISLSFQEQESYRIKLLFVLGYREEFSDTQLQKEATQKRDIVQADFIDTYRNLSLKVTLLVYSLQCTR